MLFFKKKENKLGLPDLPPSKLPGFRPLSKEAFPEENEESQDLSEITPNERHSLPSFPDNLAKKGFSQAAIKDAVSFPDESEHISEMPIKIPKAPPSLQSIPKTLPQKPFRPSQPQKQMQQPEEIPSSLVPDKNFKAVEMEEWHEERTSEKPWEVSREIPLEQKPIPKAPVKTEAKSTSVFVRIDKFHTAKRSIHEIQTQVEQIGSLLNKIRDIKMREEQELSSCEKDLLNIKARVHDITESIFEKPEY